MQQVINIREIELVEQLEGIKLFNEDVLPKVEDQRVRRVNLDKAATLTKGKDTKATIVLKTPAGYKRLVSKILGVDHQAVWIENGLVIPIQAIYAVDVL
jgi:hypothetical protein